MKFDLAGIANGDLIVIAADDLVGPSTVYRINKTGAVTPVAEIDVHAEGATAVPNDPNYGPWANTILVGEEYAGAGSIEAIPVNCVYPCTGNAAVNRVDLGIKIEDIWVVPAHSAFYGVDYNEGGPAKIWTADASQWTPFVGRILLATEHGAFLNIVDWNGSSFVATKINDGSASVDPPQAAQWEHITFAPVPQPSITIVKYTNGADANDPNGNDVPNVNPGSTITWTYVVTNTGNVSVAKADVQVTDNTTGITPVFNHEQSGNGDAVLDPGEIWIYSATGTALNLTLPPPAGVHTVPNGCTANGTQPPRTAYTNIGTVTIPGATASDPSSYCNPPQAVPNVTIVKYTNGADANDPNGSDVPNVGPGVTVTWTYKVTNTGQTAVPKAQVVVTDNTTGVTPSFSSELSGNGDAIFNPGEVWLYTATGIALDLTQPPPAGVTTVANSCTAGGTQPPRTAYTNVGTVTIPGATASDPSSYCNPPPIPCPAGSFTYSFDASGNLNIVYDQFPAPNDNSYGVNAVGWSTKGHKFTDLVGSDHAGFQLVDGNGVVKLDFKIDYISAKTGTPSGYASLGATGGDGGMNIAADGQGATGITGNSSLARNLNTLGYFVGGTQVPATKTATNGADLLLNSPPTLDTTSNYTLKTPNPWVNGWDFHDTYFVTITAARLASLGFNPLTWKVQPNADELHNSPAKACPASTGGGGCNLSVTAKTTVGKEVQVTVMNGASTDAILTGLSVTWPAANGKLMQVKLDGDIVYDNPDIPAPSANLTTAQLVADPNHRKIQHNSSDVLHLVFEKNVDTNLSHYTGTLNFGDCVVTILP